MYKALSMAVAAVAMLALSACGIIYKPNVQQGNVLKAASVEQLKPGMTKEQVLALLGQPTIASPFAQSRWDYAYSLKVPGEDRVIKDFTVFFENGVVARTKGDYQPEQTDRMLDLVSQYPIILHDKEKEAEARQERQRKGG